MTFILTSWNFSFSASNSGSRINGHRHFFEAEIDRRVETVMAADDAELQPCAASMPSSANLHVALGRAVDDALHVFSRVDRHDQDRRRSCPVCSKLSQSRSNARGDILLGFSSFLTSKPIGRSSRSSRLVFAIAVNLPSDFLTPVRNLPHRPHIAIICTRRAAARARRSPAAAPPSDPGTCRRVGLLGGRRADGR